MKFLVAILLTLLCGVSFAQNQNNPQQSWVQLLLPPVPPATGNEVSGPLMFWQGSIGVFACGGTWGGATVTLEFQLPNGTLVPAGTATTLTANGGGVFYLPAVSIQAVLSGVTSTTAVSCSAGIVPAPQAS